MSDPTGEHGSLPLRAAFGSRPDLPVRVGPTMPPVDRWLVAVALGAQGRYAAAATELGRLLADPTVPAAVAAHAAVTRAAHRRQQGGHTAARPDDALGLRLASAAPRAVPDVAGTDAWAARIDALVGLAADAVGLGVPTAAVRLLDSAQRLADGHPSWRPAVRLGWVRAELALLTGRAAEAVAPAASAVAGARAAGSARHLLKSRIVLVVALGAAGAIEPCAAVEELDAVGAECARLGLLPLRRPCALAAADLLDGMRAEGGSAGGAVGSGDPRDVACGTGAEGGSAANEWTARTAQRSPDDRSDGAARRRHAAASTMSVIEQRTDPRGKRLMGVSL